MDDDSFEPMFISDSDDESLDSSNLKDATYNVLSIDEIAHKMELVIEDVVSSTQVIVLSVLFYTFRIEFKHFFLFFFCKSLVLNSSFQMPASVVRIALSQYDWDKWKMLETFYDNQVKFFEKINVSNPFQEVATTSIAGKSAKKVECLTCYDEFPLSVSWTIFINVLNTIEYDVELRKKCCNVTHCVLATQKTLITTCCEIYFQAIASLSCNHMFCKDCWSQYLTVKINEGAELISCQNLKCNIFVDDPTVAELLTDDQIKERYKRWITNSFVLVHIFWYIFFKKPFYLD